MERLSNALKVHAGRMDVRVGQPRFGTVVSVDPEKSLARVTLQPDGVLTGWIPILSLWIGNGWGLACPPSPGDQVLVIPQEGHEQNGLIVGRGFSDQNRPPNTPIGEFWLVHRTGSSLKLTNDGRIRIKGDVYVDGDIFDREGSLNELRSTYNVHRHRIHNGSDSDQPVPQA